VGSACSATFVLSRLGTGALFTFIAPHSRARGADDGGRRRRDASYGVARDSHTVSTTAVKGSICAFPTQTERCRTAGSRASENGRLSLTRVRGLAGGCTGDSGLADFCKAIQFGESSTRRQ
jgi:hypothetical protein